MTLNTFAFYTVHFALILNLTDHANVKWHACLHTPMFVWALLEISVGVKIERLPLRQPN